MSGFDTEAEARACCRKAHYPIFVIFVGSWEIADTENNGSPMAIYVKGKGCNPQPVEKDVPYTTYRVIKDKLPAPDFEALISGQETYSEVHDKIDAAFDRGIRLLWIIHEDPRLIEVRSADGRKTWNMRRECGTLDVGDVIPGFSLPVSELFEQLVIE